MRNGDVMKNKVMLSMLIICVVVVMTACGTRGIPNIKNLSLNSKCVIVCDYTDAQTLYEKNATTKTSPASLVKLMVIILVIEKADDLDTRYATRQADYTYIKAITEDSSNDFVSGEKATLADYLYAMMFNSSADASMTALRYLGDGDTTKGVKLMNEKAKAIGMSHTHFEDAIGDDKKTVYSTCSDMARMMSYSLRNKTFKKILTSKTHTIKADNKRSSGTVISSSVLSHAGSNTLIQGGKLGYTPNAKKSLASYAKIKGREYFVISTQAETKLTDLYPNITDHENIYEALKSGKVPAQKDTNKKKS